MRVTGANGEKLTPTGGRHRALLVIIALAPNMTVGRRWLEALLWSESQSAQASGSMRQALSNTRRQLGAYAGLLQANRTDIWLDQHKVLIDVLSAPSKVRARLAEGRVFLEGIDIPAEGFEDWLRNERARHTLPEEDIAPPPPAVEDQAGIDQHNHAILNAPQLPLLYTSTDEQTGHQALELFMAEAISTQLTQTATHHFRTEVRSLEGNLTPTILSPGARFTIRVSRLNGSFLALARLIREPGGKLFWARQMRFDGDDHANVVDVAASLAVEAAEAMAAREISSSSAQTANSMAAKALQDTFSFDPDRLRNAISLLEQANAIDPFAPRPALQALAKAFLALETQAEDAADLKSDAAKLMEDAMRLDPNNAVSLSFLADVHDLIFEDPQTALAFAKCALRANPGIGYAYASLGGLELRRGRNDEALMAAQRAHRQLANSSLEVFSLMRLCVASMTLGDVDTAQEAAARAAELAPLSRPPLRHLYALRLKQGDKAGAREALRALHRLEPNFSMQMLRETPDFPAATLRKLRYHKLQDVEL